MSYLNKRQLFFILFMNLLGFSLFNNISASVKMLDKSFYIAIMLTFLFTLIPVMLFTYLKMNYPSKNIYDYCEILFNRKIAIFFCIIILLFVIAYASFNLKSISHIIKLTILPKSNENLIGFSFITLGIYGAAKGIRNVGRLCEIFGLLAIILFSVTIIVMLFNIDTLNLLPLVTNNIGDKIVSENIFLNFHYFFPIIILSVITINNEDSKKYKKVIILSLAIGAFVFLLLTCACVGIMGVNQVIKYIDSLFIAIKQIEFPFLTFMQRLDIIIITAMLFAVFCTISSFICICYELLEKVFNYTKLKTVVILFIIFTFFITIPQSIDGANILSVVTSIVFGIPAVIIIPLILSIKLFVSKKKGKIIDEAK